MAIFTDPAWSVAIATWLLLLVTGLAAFFGIRAAVAAANTFQLESEPVVLVRQLERGEDAPHDPVRLLQQFVVVGTPVLDEGFELREWRLSDKSNPNAELALNKGVTIEIHNAGRSPALAVKLPFSISVPILPERDPDPGEPSDRTKEGTGAIVLPGIAANTSIYVLAGS